MLAVFRVCHPVIDGKFKSVRAEIGQVDGRCRVSQYTVLRQRSIRQQAHHQLNIAVVTHRHHGGLQHLQIGQRQVFNPVADEHLVGHDGLAPRQRAHHGVARIDVGDAAFKPVNAHAVTNAHAALGQHDKAADITGSEFLQTKADTHTNRTTQNRQRRQVNPHRRQRQQQADKHQYRAHRIAHRLAQRKLASCGRAQHTRLDGGRNPQRDQKHHAGRQCAFQHGAHRQSRIPDFPFDAIQFLKQNW